MDGIKGLSSTVPTSISIAPAPPTAKLIEQSITTAAIKEIILFIEDTSDKSFGNRIVNPFNFKFLLFYRR